MPHTSNTPEPSLDDRISIREFAKSTARNRQLTGAKFGLAVIEIENKILGMALTDGIVFYDPDSGTAYTGAGIIALADDWLISHKTAREILRRLYPEDCAEPQIATQASRSQTPSVKHKLRTNSLDAPILKAINLAGNREVGAVFVKLRELAIAEETPFTGLVEGAALCYTNDSNEPDRLTKNALGKRLKNLAP